MALVLVVRHGQASFGAEDYDVLSETGWAQGRLLGAALAAEGLRPSVVVRGSMRRHRETTEALLESLVAAGGSAPAEEVVVDARWDEFDHLGVVAAHPDLPQGGTASLDRREFQRVFLESTRRWALGEEPAVGSVGYPETFADFVSRSTEALADACSRATDGPVVVVTSGGPVGVVAASLVGPEDSEPAVTARLWERFNTVCVNSGLSRVLVGSTGTRLLSFNEHGHLDAAHLTYR